MHAFKSFGGAVSGMLCLQMAFLSKTKLKA